MKQKVFALLALAAISCKAEHALPPPEPKAANADFSRVAGLAPPAPPSPSADAVASRPELQAPALPRMIVRTDEVSLIVGDAGATVETLARLAAAQRGYCTHPQLP